ncbi:hypothetical protein F2Q69_00050682 [Brassica cretica]|uniref:Uncharacterized protein n=1 Tax=Brassica cretica TaxID=69181 RepID=A0A8S9Q3R2_BRACR|nr:hypothetical protein F2Q69_00050682 [Brassica cretica]
MSLVGQAKSKLSCLIHFIEHLLGSFRRYFAAVSFFLRRSRAKPGHRLPANVACGLGHCCDEFMAAAGSFREASPRPSFIHDVKSPSPVGFELRPGVVLSSRGLLLRCTVTGSPRRQAAVTTIPSLSQFSTTGSMVQAVSSPPCPTPPSWSCSSSESSSPSSTRSGDKNNHSLQCFFLRRSRAKPGHRLPANVACGLGHCCDEFMAAAGSFREASPRPSFIHDVKSPSPVGFELRPGVVLSSRGLLLRCTVTGSPRRQAAVTTIPSLSQFSTTGSMVQAVSSPPCPTPPSWSCSSSESSSPSSTRSGDKNNHSLQ